MTNLLLELENTLLVSHITPCGPYSVSTRYLTPMSGLLQYSTGYIWTHMSCRDVIFHKQTFGISGAASSHWSFLSNL